MRGGRVIEVYENHLGGIYFSEYEIDPEFLYCDQCGDWDSHLGHADTRDEVLELVTDVDEDGEEWCRYAEEYLEEIKKEFEKSRREQ